MSNSVSVDEALDQWLRFSEYLETVTYQEPTQEIIENIKKWNSIDLKKIRRTIRTISTGYINAQKKMDQYSKMFPTFDIELFFLNDLEEHDLKFEDIMNMFEWRRKINIIDNRIKLYEKLHKKFFGKLEGVK